MDSDDREVLDRLEAAEQAYAFEKTAFWKETVAPALDLQARQCQIQLIDIDPMKTTEIIRLQERIKIFRNFIPNLLMVMKKNGEAAYEEAKERDLLTISAGVADGQ